MTKVHKNLEQVNTVQKKYSIPFGKYCIDSFKLLIDTEHFKSVNVPENFIELSSDTGEQIREFKRKSIQIAYNNTTIYVGVFRKILRQKTIDKVAILFSSKVAGDNYFNGITKGDVLQVLQHIKNCGYFDFDDIETIYKNLYSKDVDVKVDFRFDLSDRDKINDYNRQLQDRFIHNKEHLHRYTGTNKLGIQTFNRDRTSKTKPFIKFYDKTSELKTKHQDFLSSLPDDIKMEISDNFIYRYEYTLKDKEFMANFGIINRLEDTLEVVQDKWREIGKTLLNANFQVKMNIRKNIGKLTPTEKILALMFFELYQKHNVSLMDIQTMFTSGQTEKKAKYLSKKLFEKIYSHVSFDNAKEVEQLAEKYETIKKFDVIFGLV